MLLCGSISSGGGGRVVVLEVVMALAAVVVKVLERLWMLFKIFHLKFINI